MNDPATPTPPPPQGEYPQQLGYVRIDDAPGVNDVSHLNTLAICHYVWGGLIMLFSSFGIIYIILGVTTMNDPSLFAPASTTPTSRPPPSTFLSTFFIVFGSAMLLIGWIVGILSIFSGRSLQKQVRRTFSFVIAGVNCIFFPLGTTLAVFTFIVLSRAGVKGMYRRSPLRPI
jgi:hypothetical protein